MKQVVWLLFFMLFTNVISEAQPVNSAKRLTVAQDGSGDFVTIQSAVNAVRDLGQWRVTIFIKKGIYQEKLVIPDWKIKISLIGEDKMQTIITNSDYSGKAFPGGKDAFGNEKFSTYTSHTLLIQGADCTLENLTVENGAGRVGQAVALHVEGDRCVVKNCRILGNQDTLYATREGSRQYYEDCLIEGTTDFIFGLATAVFQRCTIKSLANSYITAAATPQGRQFGFVFLNCKVIADTSVHKVYLGRPWRAYAKTVFINCVLGKHIVPEGWDPWKGDAMFKDKEKTAYYAEYGNTGAGASPVKRVSWSKQLTAKEAQLYKLSNILSGTDGWKP